MLKCFLQFLAFEAGWYTWRLKKLLGLRDVALARIIFSIERPDHVSIRAKQIGHQRPGAEPVSLQQRGSARIEIADGVVVRRGVRICAEGSGKIRIGASTTIGKGSALETYGAAGIEIGKNCRIGWNVLILPSDQHMIQAAGTDTGFEADINIGDHVWIGTRAVILKGTRIGKDSVVSAGAVCSGEFAVGSLIAGVPARTIRSGVNWRNVTAAERLGVTQP